MLVQDLTQISLFDGLNEDQLSLIQPLLELCDFSKDTVVFEQGDVARYLYIVLKGEVLVRYKAYDGPVITVARTGAGGVFGWSSVLARPAYSSGAVCLEDTLTFRISGMAMQRLCETYPETGVILIERLANVIADHLKNTHNEILSLLTQGVEANGGFRRYSNGRREPILHA